MLCIFVTSKPQNKPALKSLQIEFMQAIWSYYYVATIEINHFSAEGWVDFQKRY